MKALLLAFILYASVAAVTVDIGFDQSYVTPFSS